MKRWKTRGLSLLLVLVLLLGLHVTSFAAVSEERLASVIADTAEYMYQTVRNPQVGSIGGEWAVLGLARSGYDIPKSYYGEYYAAVEKYVVACKGKLHDKKYTEYSRLIVALSAIGKDARSVAGYDLTKALGDYDKTIWQGINGSIWALIALDSRDYPMPENPEAKTQATRQMYIDHILECQLSDGGWSLSGSTAATAVNGGDSDPDVTGMALQALAKYRDQPAVSKAIEEALACMSEKQDASGGYSSWGTANSESCVQMIIALCELGISTEDSRFVKEGRSMVDNLLTYYRPGNGFLHTTSGSGSNQMASEQALYALVAVQRTRGGRNSLYRMGDAVSLVDDEADVKQGEGLEGKHRDVQPVAITAPGTTFDDIVDSDNIAAIEAMASRGIISGRGDGRFDPDAGMTRAEFATIVVRSLGLTPKINGDFTDVKSGDWFAGYVGTASQYGIISGVGNGKFNPRGTITRQEAAVMVSKAAKLCGMETAMESGAVRDMLAQFSDYMTTSQWAQESLAFCYSAEILDDSALSIQPKVPIKRCEIAQMLFNLLGSANLL